MQIRLAAARDTDRVLYILRQVLEVHAALRPDLFISGTTKYTKKDLLEIFQNDKTPVYVAVDEEDLVMGYCFCEIHQQDATNNMPAMSWIYIDDLCVDEAYRGRHIASALFEYVKDVAKDMGCFEINLNVWEGNHPARSFYENAGMRIKKTTMEYLL